MKGSTSWLFIFLLSVTVISCAAAEDAEGEKKSQDTTAPTIMHKDPENSASGVTPRLSLSALFSESLDSSTITSSVFILIDPSGDSIGGTVSYDPTSDIVKFAPATDLSANISYTATITTGVQDVAGNALASDEVWTFRTGKQQGGAIQGATNSHEGIVTTFAGMAGMTGFSDTSLNDARGLTTDGLHLFVADYGSHQIKKVVISAAAMTNFAGAGASASNDGTGTSAGFDSPSGITTDGTNLYITEAGTDRIRKIVISSQVVTHFAGATGPSTEGSADGTSDARFNEPYGITTDGINLYVSDYSNHTIRKIVISSGVVSTFAGLAETAGTSDGTSDARFSSPAGITTDGTNLYIADQQNHTIRKIVLDTGVVSTFAGMAQNPGSTDGIGTAARFQTPSEITTDGTNLYVADSMNNIIRKIVISTQAVSTLAGSGTNNVVDGTGTSAQFSTPKGITTVGGALYVSEESGQVIRKIR